MDRKLLVYYHHRTHYQIIETAHHLTFVGIEPEYLECLSGGLESKTLANSYYSKYKPSKNSLKKHKVLEKLKSNGNIVIVKPDKGNGVVIVEKQDYVKGMLDIFGDVSKFKVLASDPTIYREGQLQRRLLSLKKKGFFTDKEYEKVYPGGSNPARA